MSKPLRFVLPAILAVTSAIGVDAERALAGKLADAVARAKAGAAADAGTTPAQATPAPTLTTSAAPTTGAAPTLAPPAELSTIPAPVTQTLVEAAQPAPRILLGPATNAGPTLTGTPFVDPNVAPPSQAAPDGDMNHKLYHNILRTGNAATTTTAASSAAATPALKPAGEAAPVVVKNPYSSATSAATGTSPSPALATRPATSAPSATQSASAQPTIAAPSTALPPKTPTTAAPRTTTIAPAITSSTPAVTTPSTPTPATAPKAATGTAATPAPTRGSVIVSDDREAGAPAVERKSVIGREPADASARKLFEAEKQQPTLTPEMETLRKRVQTALAHYYKNWTLNTRDHSPWEVMHAIVAYGVDTRLHKGTPGGPTTTAIGHLCFSGICNNQPILTIRGGKLYALRGPGVQGHSGQFLAILAQSYLQRDYPLYVGGQEFTLEDLIKAEQLDCESGTELTFKLIALMHYLPSDATWVNFQGQTWSLDRLVREEIVQPVRGAACGGTHRLMGLSYALRKREQRGEPITGVYADARKYIDQYHRYTFGLQNKDGSFSTAWFVRPEARNDLDRRLQTTGHTLEWLCFSLTDEQLRDPRIVKSVRYVTDLLLNERISEWEVGHLGHALHALQIYNERVFGGPIRSFESLVRKPTTVTR